MLLEMSCNYFCYSFRKLTSWFMKVHLSWNFAISRKYLVELVALFFFFFCLTKTKTIICKYEVRNEESFLLFNLNVVLISSIDYEMGYAYLNILHKQQNILKQSSPIWFVYTKLNCHSFVQLNNPFFSYISKSVVL